MSSPSIAVERRVPLLDLHAQHRTIRNETIAEVIRVIDSQHFILGDDVKKLEVAIAEYCSTPFAIGCASGSDALFLALLAAGVGPGDKVLTTPYTFFATVGAICRAGATPVFADVEPETFNLDPARVEEAFRKHPEIRAVIPVHLFGACADMDPICRMAASAGSTVIEDAAQSIGSEYNERRAGSIGDIGCFSFFPSKNLGAYGDGGIVTTKSSELAAKLAALRVHGTKRKYYHDFIGVNSRLDALQAAVLRVKLHYLDEWTAGRQRNAQLYREQLAALNVPVILPGVKAHTTRHIYNQFVICGERRDDLQRFLKERGIGSEVYYPLPMHIQTCFAHLGYRVGDFPISEKLANTSLALPVYPELPPEDLAYVCATVKEFYG